MQNHWEQIRKAAPKASENIERFPPIFENDFRDSRKPRFKPDASGFRFKDRYDECPGN